MRTRLGMIEPPPPLPPQAPTWMAPTTWQIMAEQMAAGWQQARETPPPGGYTIEDRIRQAGQFLAQHSTAVYITAAGLLALALFRRSGR